MKLLKNKLVAIMLIITLFSSIAAISFAWFTESVTVFFPPLSGGTSSTAYFADGDGSEDNPYIITDAIHLYNLAWLQYIGYFNMGLVNNGKAQSYFEVKNDIDMDGLPLPPIGTTQYPFVGNFNGNGKIIKNLTVANARSNLNQHPTGVFGSDDMNDLLLEYESDSGNESGAVIGFFGVIGTYTGGNVPADLDESKICVKNFGLTDYILYSNSTATTVGIVAGYVNATVSNVLVGNCTLNTGTGVGGVTTLTGDTVSEHTLIGYCENAYEETVKNTVFSIYDPKVSDTLTDINNVGTNANWGGSIAMKTLYQNLVIDYASATEIGAYSLKQIGYYSTTGNLVHTEAITSSQNYSRGDYASEYTGSVVYYSSSRFANSESGTMYLGGGSWTGTYQYAYSGDANLPKYTISYTSGSTTYYLNASTTNGMMSISAGTTATTQWTLTTDGDLFADVNGAAVYLIIDGTLKASPVPSTTKWEYNSGTFTTTAGTEGTLAYSIDKNEWNYIGAKKYYIKATGNNYYLAIDSTLTETAYSNRGTFLANYISLVNTTSTDSAAEWTKSGTDDNMILTTEITKSDGVTYTYHFAHLVSDTTYQAMVVVADRPQSNIHNIYLLKYNANNILYFGRSNTTSNDRYLTYTASGESATWTKTSTVGSAQAIEFVEASADASLQEATAANTANDGQKLVASASGDEKMSYDGDNVTYIPLQGDNSQNTGYIVSGIYSGRTGTEGNYNYSEGTDIRVSGYTKEGNITSDSTLYYHNRTTFTSYTIPTTTVTTNPNGWQKFISSYYGTDTSTGFKDFVSGTNVYGLHFMNGNISADSLVTIPKAYINNVQKTNYQVPADCIDCHVSSKGFITFYAGTYFEGNNAFFSLHKIVRYTNGDTIPVGKKVNDIKDIKEIQSIYSKSGTTSYIYKYKTDDKYYYANGTEASGLNIDDCTLCFDTDWLTAPDSWNNNSIYYFEIPVDAGEYALGSVTGKTGAYLLYLDIGASLQDEATQNINRTIVYEMFEEKVQDYTYAKGVGIIDSAYETVTSPNFSMTLAKNYGTNITLDRTDTTVTVSSTAVATANLNSTGGFTVTGSNVTLNNPTGAKTITTKQVTYMDQNITAGGTIIKTVITWNDANSNGAVDDGEVTYETGGTWTTEPNSSGNITTFQLSHHSSQDSINWTDDGVQENEKIWSNLTATVLAYQYDPASGVTITNSPVLTLTTNTDGTYTGKGIYDVVVSATASTTVTITKNDTSSSTTVTEADVTAGDSNVTITQ